MHVNYCAFMYTLTEKHVCFSVISLLVLTFDPTGKGSIPSKTDESDNFTSVVCFGWPLQWFGLPENMQQKTI